MRRPLSGAVITLLLLLFAATGLMAGALTHILVVSPAIIHGGAPTTQRQPTHTPTPSTPTATTAPVAVTGTFTLTIDVSPANVALAPGQRIQVNVQALRPNGRTPVAGLTCELGAPTSGRPLLTQWPAPAVTNATGHARWTITVPATASGKYKLQATAHASDGSYYYVYMSVTVS
jgi:hypothetical protein